MTGSPNAPGVFFLCPDDQEPTGGIAAIYRQVEILAAAGTNAYVLHTTPGFRCRWFESTAPVASAAFRPLTPHDLLVVPEVYGPKLHEIAPATPFAIFDQSISHIFNEWPVAETGDPQSSPFRSDRLLGIVCVSDLSLEYMRWLFPDLPSVRVRHGVVPIETDRLADRPMVATYMPRRNDDHAREVINALRIVAGDACSFHALSGLDHAAVVERLRASRIFLSFGGPEGFGLPVLEAMNAGCLVVGYHGYGGQELLTPDTGVPIDLGDIPGFARTCAATIDELARDPSRLQAIADRGMAEARARYSPTAQVESVVAAWGAIIAAHPHADGLAIGTAPSEATPVPGFVAFDARESEIASLRQTAHDLEQAMRDLERQLNESRAAEHAAREHLRRIHASAAWRAAQPLRVARRRVLRLDRPGDPPPTNDS